MDLGGGNGGLLSRPKALGWGAEEQDTGSTQDLSGVMDLKPTSTSQQHSEAKSNSSQASSSWTGLPDWAQGEIQGMTGQMMPSTIQGYQELLGAYTSPESYMARFDPYEEQLIDEYNARGLIGGDVMAKALSKAATQQYAQEQATAAQLFQGLLGELNKALASTQETTSHSSGSSSSQQVSDSYSYAEDPTVMISQILNLLPSMFS